MADFNSYLESSGEVGYVEKIFQVLIYVKGLPSVKVSELVVFETGETGQVLSLTDEYAEVLILSNSNIALGTKVARTGKDLSVLVGPHLLGKVIDPLGVDLWGMKVEKPAAPNPKLTQARSLHATPLGIQGRKNINQPFETGVALVDSVVSLGKGQRELVVGERKSGKTPFLTHTAYAAALKGMVVIYAAIAKKRSDTKGISDFFEQKGVGASVIVVASASSDPASLVHLTPYTAMTIAEYFRDMGRDVLIIMDDMSAHAKYYREITLLARRFPGRSAYPGDIFHIHAQLMERAGNFVLSTKTQTGDIERKEVSITCLPVAEAMLGDLSGYIETNLMSMTDGHIYFDIDLFNEGRRPAVNPFLSVTRVGRQAQTPLVRDMSRRVTQFLIRQRELEQFMHFGTELTEKSKQELALGVRVREFFNQESGLIIPLNMTVMIMAGIMLAFWKGKDATEFKQEVKTIVTKYHSDETYRKNIDQLVTTTNTFDALIDSLKANKSILI